MRPGENGADLFNVFQNLGKSKEEIKQEIKRDSEEFWANKSRAFAQAAQSQDLIVVPGRERVSYKKLHENALNIVLFMQNANMADEHEVALSEWQKYGKRRIYVKEVPGSRQHGYVDLADFSIHSAGNYPLGVFEENILSAVVDYLKNNA